MKAYPEVGFPRLPEPAYAPETQAGQNYNHGDDHIGHPDGMGVAAASRVKQARREQGNDEQ
jgi:hypothetical protein